ncbi:MAG: glycosyltransferase [Gammaproteobacteria bacterium]|nr:glycosyltransferase [Gammaproteobacteria bacterium]
MKVIVLFIRSLNTGGAERQLVITAKGLAERGYDIIVLTFYSGGAYEKELSDCNVKLLSLGKKGRWDLFAFFFRLIKLLRQLSPDVIYSFLGAANILSVFIRPFIPEVKVVWGVRASNVDLKQYDRLFHWVYWVECRLSRFADTVIANSYAGLDYAVAHGFSKKNMVVIPNGIDTERFQPDEKAGSRVRQEWDVAEDATLIGVVGRIDPMKGYVTFLEAVARITVDHPQMRFVCVGNGEAMYEKSIHNLATELCLDDVLVWAGQHSDMTAVYNAFDIVVSSSYGEGFSNVIGEAMSCGVPCVVTDVGDSRLIAGDVGQVVPPNDSKSLADAILIELTLNNRGDLQRDKIINQYSVERLFDKTEEALSAV